MSGREHAICLQQICRARCRSATPPRHKNDKIRSLRLAHALWRRFAWRAAKRCADERSSLTVGRLRISEERIATRMLEAERGSQYKFMTGNSIREYAESLRIEMLKRRLRFTPIDWWTDRPSETSPSPFETRAKSSHLRVTATVPRPAPSPGWED